MNILKKTRLGVAVAAGLGSLMMGGNVQAIDYEVWGSDQSNSVAGVASRGVNGGYMQIFDSADIEAYVAGTAGAPSPVACNSGATPGPCSMHDIFPAGLTESDEAGPTGGSLGVGAIGRVHGALPDPQHMYVNVNLFNPGAGYVGIMTADTKEAVALFRVTGTNKGRSNHMSFWGADGNTLFIANLHGRILERIDFTRDEHGTILTATFNKSASMSTGATSITDGAKAYTGINGAGNAMIGTVSGAYGPAATATLTPNGNCIADGCGAGPDAGRPGNVIVCPIVSSNNKVYVTFGGGGLLVADGVSTPMAIVGEYSNDVMNGAGCGGVEAGGGVYLNAGASAAPAGASQSVFTMYRLSTNFPNAGTSYPLNFPRPRTIFKDPGNTLSGGATSGVPTYADGQQPSGAPNPSTRRDAHGAVGTTNGHYVVQADRIQNNMTSFDVATGSANEYTLENGVCASVAAAGVPAGFDDDLTPDLMDRSPNGDFLFVASRGPIPVSVGHNAKGSCPGFGVIRITEGGKSGELVKVVRTYNTVDTAPAATGLQGGYDYLGTEHSDVHGVAVVIK